MKKYSKILLSLVIMFIMIGFFTISNAVTVTEADIEEFINSHTSIDLNNVTEADVITIYEELSDQYTNEELADIVEQYSGELKEAGVEPEVINAGTAILRTTDSEELKEIIKEDIDVDSIKTKLENGENTGDIVDSMQDAKMLKIALKVLLANKIVKAILTIFAIIAVYMIVVRWIIYKKAGKHGWAAIIPIYRDVVWLKIAGISPWLLLLVLIPVIGWAILAIIFVISKFTLPTEFGRSAGWGLGIWILPVIFESVVAFSSGFEYKGNK